MSKKYVPRFLQEDSVSQTPLYTTGRSIVYSSGYSKTDSTEKPLVNTSLPAKEAPSLAPATLASLTGNGETAPTTSSTGRFSAYKPQGISQRARVSNVNLSSDQDFPSLGGVSKKEAVETPAKPSFAEMAKEWAKKQKEEEEVKKKEDEKNALIEAERRRKEKEDRTLFTSIHANFSKLLHSKPVDEEDHRYVEEDVYRVEEDVSDTETSAYQDEEEPQEYVDDDIWNKRKNKHDIY